MAFQLRKPPFGSFFLEKELTKDKKSSIIINIDLSGMNSEIGNIGNYIPNYPITRELIGKQEKAYYRVPFVKYFGKFESYTKFFLNQRLNLTKITDRGGSYEKKSTPPKEFEKMVSRRKKSYGEFVVEEPLVEKLHRLIDATERRIFFVIAPYHESYLAGVKNPTEIRTFLNKLGEKENVTVLDLRRVVSNDTLFYNTSHLNFQGARAFSQELKTELELNR